MDLVKVSVVLERESILHFFMGLQMWAKSTHIPKMRF